ncbi:MAG: hypothetical protein JZU64_00070 [Rhodoferax sp.]|jgi:hypothetical protein|nr:hypothetical protein [Rhodoferax sp.]
MAEIIELLSVSDAAPAAGRGWQQAVLKVFGVPYWCADDGQPISWVWQDFLAGLVRNWSALMLEEIWPLRLTVRHPGELWDKAEQRWQTVSDLVVQEEEKALYAFWHRHNLALWLPGLALPALICVRTGQQVWVVTADQTAKRVALPLFRRELEAIGNSLAMAYAGFPDANALALCQRWRERDRQMANDYFRFRSGSASDDVLQQMWRSGISMAANDVDWYGNEPPMLAAARMGRQCLRPDTIKSLWTYLSAQPPAPGLPAHFESLSLAAVAQLASMLPERAYVQGYALAQWLRSQWGLSAMDDVDIEKFLRHEATNVKLRRTTPLLPA